MSGYSHFMNKKSSTQHTPHTHTQIVFLTFTRWNQKKKKKQKFIVPQCCLLMYEFFLRDFFYVLLAKFIYWTLKIKLLLQLIAHFRFLGMIQFSRICKRLFFLKEQNQNKITKKKKKKDEMYPSTLNACNGGVDYCEHGNFMHTIYL